MTSGCRSWQPVSYSRTLHEKASKSKGWHFEGKPITCISSVNHQFLCKCAAFLFFVLLSFSATDARAHLLLSCLFREPSLTEPHGLDRCFVYCLEIKKKTYRRKREKKKMKWIPKEAKQASRREAANVRNWFTVTAKRSRWRLNANGTEQSNFRQNT